MIDAIKQALEAEINLVLTDPDSSLSAGAQRALQYVSNQIQAIEKAEKQELAVQHLWECIGRWSSYLAVNGTQANMAPPNWLLDAVKAATSQPPKREWRGLTGLEVSHYNSRLNGSGVAEEIQAKLRERNT
jgi:hypothetical protein